MCIKTFQKKLSEVYVPKNYPRLTERQLELSWFRPIRAVLFWWHTRIRVITVCDHGQTLMWFET